MTASMPVSLGVHFSPIDRGSVDRVVARASIRMFTRCSKIVTEDNTLPKAQLLVQLRVSLLQPFLCKDTRNPAKDGLEMTKSSLQDACGSTRPSQHLMNETLQWQELAAPRSCSVGGVAVRSRTAACRSNGRIEEGSLGEGRDRRWELEIARVLKKLGVDEGEWLALLREVARRWTRERRTRRRPEDDGDVVRMPHIA